jgi:hypothetical protein
MNRGSCSHRNVRRERNILDEDAWIDLTFLSKDSTPRVSRRVVIECQTVWDRPRPLYAVDQSGSYDFAPFAQSEPVTTQGRLLDTFTDAYLRWSDCFFLGDEFQCFFEDSAETYARVLAEREFGLERQRAAQIVVRNGRLVVPKTAFQDPVVVDENVLWATPHEPRNWGLWLLHSLPAVARLFRTGGSILNCSSTRRIQHPVRC